jgi:hypothetical protein
VTGSLVLALVLLAINGVVGAVDTLWYHEISGKLPVQGGGVRGELALHAARDAVYCLVYGTLPWVAWSGAWAYLLIGLLAIELVITFADFAVEARVREVSAGERILHTSMGIIYGAAMAALLPVVLGWADGPTGWSAHAEPVPAVLQWTLTAFAAGIAVSGIRDGVAAAVGPAAGLPWRVSPPAPEVRRHEVRPAMVAAVVVGIVVPAVLGKGRER